MSFSSGLHLLGGGALPELAYCLLMAWVSSFLISLLRPCALSPALETLSLLDQAFCFKNWAASYTFLIISYLKSHILELKNYHSLLSYYFCSTVKCNLKLKKKKNTTFPQLSDHLSMTSSYWVTYCPEHWPRLWGGPCKCCAALGCAATQTCLLVRASLLWFA